MNFPLVWNLWLQYIYSVLEFLTLNFPLQIWSLKENFWGIEIIFPSFPRANFLPPYFPKYHSQLWPEYLNEFQGKMPLCLTDSLLGLSCKRSIWTFVFIFLRKSYHKTRQNYLSLLLFLFSYNFKSLYFYIVFSFLDFPSPF